jgi:hypothetical protein
MFNYFINYINDKYIKNIKEKNIRYLNFKNFTLNKIKNNNFIIKDNIYYKDCEELKNFITVLNINKDLKYNLSYKENTNECYYEVYIKK